MFESAEIGHKMSKGEYKRIEPALRAELLDAQYQLRSAYQTMASQMKNKPQAAFSSRRLSRSPASASSSGCNGSCGIGDCAIKLNSHE